MGIIKPLKNKEGKNIYPITRAEAIFIEDNKKLSSKINEIESNRKNVVNTTITNINLLKDKNITRDINLIKEKENKFKNDLSVIVTEKGVETNPNDSYDIISTNIRNIPQEEMITQELSIVNAKIIDEEYTLKDKYLKNVEIKTDLPCGTETDDGNYKLTFSVENMTDINDKRYKNTGAEVIIPKELYPDNRIFEKTEGNYVYEEPSLNKIGYNHKYRKGGFPEASMVGTWNNYGSLKDPKYFQSRACSVVYKDKLYIFGNDKNEIPITEAVQLSIYDFINNEWEYVNVPSTSSYDKTSLMCNMKDSMMVAYNDRLYIFGGINTSTTSSTTNEVGFLDILIYDIPSKLFIKDHAISDFKLPTKLTECGYTMVGNKVYIIGGRTGINTYNTKCYCMDLDIYKVYEVPELNTAKISSKLLKPILFLKGYYLTIIGGERDNYLDAKAYNFFYPNFEKDGTWSWAESYTLNTYLNEKLYGYCINNGSLYVLKNNLTTLWQIKMNGDGTYSMVSSTFNLPFNVKCPILASYNDEIYFYSAKKDNTTIAEGSVLKLHEDLLNPVWKFEKNTNYDIYNSINVNTTACSCDNLIYLFSSSNNKITIYKFYPSSYKLELYKEVNTITEYSISINSQFYNGNIYLQVKNYLLEFSVLKGEFTDRKIQLPGTETAPYSSLKIFNGKIFIIGWNRFLIINIDTFTIEKNISRVGSSSDYLATDRENLYIINSSNGTTNIIKFDYISETLSNYKTLNGYFPTNKCVQYLNHVYSLVDSNDNIDVNRHKVLSLNDFSIKEGGLCPISNLKTIRNTIPVVFCNKIFLLGTLYIDKNNVAHTDLYPESIILPSAYKQKFYLTEGISNSPHTIRYNTYAIAKMNKGYDLNGQFKDGQRIVEYNLSCEGVSTNKTIITGENICDTNNFSMTIGVVNNPWKINVYICGGTIKDNSGKLLPNGIYREDVTSLGHFITTTPIMTGPYEFSRGSSIVVNDKLYVIFPRKLSNDECTTDINIYDLKNDTYIKTISVNTTGKLIRNKSFNFNNEKIIIGAVNENGDDMSTHIFSIDVKTDECKFNRKLPYSDFMVLYQNYLIFDDYNSSYTGYLYMYNIDKNVILSPDEIPVLPLDNFEYGTRGKMVFQAKDLIYLIGGLYRGKNGYSDKVRVLRIPNITSNSDLGYNFDDTMMHNPIFNVCGDIYTRINTRYNLAKLSSNRNFLDFFYSTNFDNNDKSTIFYGMCNDKILAFLPDRIISFNYSNGAYSNMAKIDIPFSTVNQISVVNYRDKIFIFSPVVQGIIERRKVFMYEYNKGITEKASRPGPACYDYTTCLVGDEIYCFGGKLKGDNEYSNTCMVYNIKDNTWKTKRNKIPSKKPYLFRAIRVGNIIYLMGGYITNENHNILLYYIEEDRYELSDFNYSSEYFNTCIDNDDEITILGHSGNIVTESDYSIKSIKTHGWHKEDYIIPYFFWATKPILKGDYFYYPLVLEGDGNYLIKYNHKINKIEYKYNLGNSYMSGTRNNEYIKACIDDKKENIYVLFFNELGTNTLSLSKVNLTNDAITPIFVNKKLTIDTETVSPAFLSQLYFYNNKIYMVLTNTNKICAYNLQSNLLETLKDVTTENNSKFFFHSSIRIGNIIYYFSNNKNKHPNTYIGDVLKYDLENNTYEKITIKNLPDDFYCIKDIGSFNIGNKIYIHNHNYNKIYYDFLVIDLDINEAYYSKIIPGNGNIFDVFVYDENSKIIYMMGGFNFTPNITRTNYLGIVKTFNYGEVINYKTPKNYIPIEPVKIPTLNHKTIIKPVNCPNVNISCKISIDATPDK